VIRRNAVKLASYAAAWSGLLTCVDRWNNRRGGIILVFHDVSSETLTRHLTQIEEGYEFVSLTEMVERIAQGKSASGLAVISFDDGLKNVTQSAAVLARRHGWPMTFFLPTRSLNDQQPFWFQELDPLLARAIGRTLVIDDKKYPVPDDRAMREVANILDVRFKSHTTEEQSVELMKKIRQSLFNSAARPAGIHIPESLTWNQVRELAQQSELSFESHSITHRATSCLPSATLMSELLDSKERIENVTGRAVQHFCYPYGSPRDIGPEAPQLVQKFFRSGVTMTRGRCSSENNLSLLPRVPLYESDSEKVVALKVGTAR
jgi:peptidoglycan/xylan/chitin deacetylase (PgdA/CDA1 family)